MSCYTSLIKRITNFQENGNLKKHLTITLVLFLSALLLKFIYHPEQRQTTKEDRDIAEHNFNAIDFALHLFTSLTLLYMIFLITLIINKKSSQISIGNMNLQENLINTCSIQLIGSREDQFASARRPQLSQASSIELQTLSRVKPTNLETIHETHDQFSSRLIIDIPPKKQAENIPQIQYSSLLQRALKYENGQYQTVFIIQKCQKQSDCNFFWISTLKTQSICLNCDQNNQIEGQQTSLIFSKQILQETKSLDTFEKEMQLSAQCQSINFSNKYLIVNKCGNFDFCGFFWISKQQEGYVGSYCPSCDGWQEAERLSVAIEIGVICTYCNQQTNEYYLSNCSHPYHQKCLQDMISSQNSPFAQCIQCKCNMTCSLRQQNIIPLHILDKFYQNQVNLLIKNWFHEGIEDLEYRLQIFLI